MLPGEVSSSNSLTSIQSGDLLEFQAGTTYLFTIYLRDIYDNALLTGDSESEIKIQAVYVNHNDWPSPIGATDLHNWEVLYGRNIVGLASDNQDSTYQGQLTIYRAGYFSLNVMINGQHVINSPW